VSILVPLYERSTLRLENFFRGNAKAKQNLKNHVDLRAMTVHYKAWISFAFGPQYGISVPDVVSNVDIKTMEGLQQPFPPTQLKAEGVGVPARRQPLCLG